MGEPPGCPCRLKVTALVKSPAATLQAFGEYVDPVQGSVGAHPRTAATPATSAQGLHVEHQCSLRQEEAPLQYD